MNPQQIFELQFVLSLFVGTLLARWYVWPSLVTLPLRRALMPLLFVHATRYIGLVFLVPTVVPPGVPTAFAKPAAYGDLLAALLAVVALLALRGDWPGALPVAWLVNVVGVIDLINALFQGVRSGVSLGAAYYIPIAAVPVLLITHAMMFVLLGKGRRAGRMP
ncbi:MAG TPA: hypothetical protein VL948_11600 [Verrucomicrobiae bacterium]|jgi:hypothetical protein|nr:hypothetical protein [Verrucomicrobiae bacterium]